MRYKLWPSEKLGEAQVVDEIIVKVSEYAPNVDKEYHQRLRQQYA